MTFKPAIWYPIAVVLSVFNLVSVAIVAEPWHATIHAALALGFGLWAQRLRQRPGRSELPARPEALEAELDTLQQQLGERRERRDFAERRLGHGWGRRRPGRRPCGTDGGGLRRRCR